MIDKFPVSSMHGYGITVRNVNEALSLGMQLVKQVGRPVTSRGMETLEVPGPVMTVYKCPMERVLACPDRDANPFFHFFEALWILAGSRTVDMPAQFLGRIADYSDDNKTFHGAYGHRLRVMFGYDQIERAIELLKAKPDTRQAVLSIWDARVDLGAKTKDVPCNDMITFKVREGRLNMTVFNRSNDVIWGAYGANAVQFSVLQEYVAARVGFPVGIYTQISDSFHIYTDNALWKQYVAGSYQPSGFVSNPYDQPYDDKGYSAIPLFNSATDAFAAYEDAKVLNTFAEAKLPLHVAITRERSLMYQSSLMRNIGVPMLAAFCNYKANDLEGARALTQHIAAPDWRVNCDAWLARRQWSRAQRQEVA